MDTRQAAIDIFACIVEFNPSMVREFIVQEGQSQEDVSSPRSISLDFPQPWAMVMVAMVPRVVHGVEFFFFFLDRE